MKRRISRRLSQRKRASRSWKRPTSSLCSSCCYAASSISDGSSPTELEVNNCSREGARFAVVNADDPDLSSLVTGRVASVAGLGDAGDITVDVDFVGSQDVRVSVIKRVQVLTPLAGIFVPDQEIDLESTTVMRIG